MDKRTLINSKQKGLWLAGVLTLENLSDLYLDQKLSQRKIAEKLDISQQVVSNYLKKHGLKARSVETWARKYEESSELEKFQKPAGDWYAYWLGFIAADGCVHKGKNSSMVRLKLHLKDKHHIKEFKRGLGINNPIKERPNDKSIAAYIEFHGNKFVEILAKWGIDENKTSSFRFPEMPKELLPAFVRGYFDGDGTIYWRSKGYKPQPVCRFISGSVNFLNELADYLSQFKILCSPIYKNGASNAFVLPLSNKRENLERFAKFIYPKGVVCLQRKRDLFLPILEGK